MTRWLYIFYCNILWILFEENLILIIEIRIYCSISAIILTNREEKSYVCVCVCVERKIYIYYATVGCERSAKGSRVDVNRWRVLLKAESPSSKNRQDAFFTSYRSQRTAFAVRQREAPACARLHGSWIFNTHAHRGHAMEEWRKVSRIVTVMCA